MDSILSHLTLRANRPRRHSSLLNSLYCEGMPRSNAGFEEIEHTADWALKVWAPDLPALFEQAALGMDSLSGVKLDGQSSLDRRLELEAPDAETVAKCALDLGSKGSVTTETIRAFTEDEYRKIIGALP